MKDLEALLVIPCPRTKTGMFERQHQYSLVDINVIICDQALPLCLPDVIVCDKISQASPLYFCILQAIEKLEVEVVCECSTGIGNTNSRDHGHFGEEKVVWC